MKYRKLRIAWSVAWGIACLLLIVLWVLSYRIEHKLAGVTHTRMLFVTSRAGVFWIMLWTPAPQDAANGTLDERLNDGRVQFVTREYRETPVVANEWQHAKLAAGFGRWRDDLTERVYIPHWFVVCMSAVIAVAPWIKWSRRFSLRTLLIGMTVAAIGLGWLIYVLRGNPTL